MEIDMLLSWQTVAVKPTCWLAAGSGTNKVVAACKSATSQA